MKKQLSRTEAKGKIEKFFQQHELKPEDVKKIKKLAMKYNIKLGIYRKRFCKKCYSDLKKGKIRISKVFKSVECPGCGEVNRWKINISVGGVIKRKT